MAKIRIEDIRKECEEHNWKVITTEYTNLDTQMKFVCGEGHTIVSPWKMVRGKFACAACEKNPFKEEELSKVIPKPRGATRVLSIDQATKKSGWAIFDNGNLVKYGVFETSLESDTERLNAVKNWLISMINIWKPDHIAIEDIQLQNKGGFDDTGDNVIGVTTFKTLAKLQGVVIQTIYEAKIPYTVCMPAVWRKFNKIKGKSRADKKKSAQILVKDCYDITLTDDAAEAILIGRYACGNLEKYEISSWE